MVSFTSNTSESRHFRAFPLITQDPEFGSVYVTLVEGERQVSRTVELIADQVMADYDADGNLVGIEIL